MDVLVADADAATRAGVRMALHAGGIAVCGEVESSVELIAAAVRVAPDVCLIDVKLPGDAVAAVSELTALGRGSRVIMLATDPDESEFLAAMRAGAAGYLDKRISPSRLPAVVRSVVAGEAAIPRGFVTTLLGGLRTQGVATRFAALAPTGVTLTHRECQVLDLLRDGLSTREMANCLSITDVTVRRHIGSVLKKLHVHNRGEALDLIQSA